jgi:hypothetical protein
MSQNIRRIPKGSIRLDEPIVRIAEHLSDRYRVTVQQLVEALVLGCAESSGDAARDAAAAAAPPSPAPVEMVGVPRARRPRGPGKVIDLCAARRRRTHAAERVDDDLPIDPHGAPTRIEILAQRSRILREQAVAVREMSARTRALALLTRTSAR